MRKVYKINILLESLSDTINSRISIIDVARNKYVEIYSDIDRHIQLLVDKAKEKRDLYKGTSLKIKNQLDYQVTDLQNKLNKFRTDKLKNIDSLTKNTLDNSATNSSMELLLSSLGFDADTSRSLVSKTSDIVSKGLKKIVSPDKEKSREQEDIDAENLLNKKRKAQGKQYKAKVVVFDKDNKDNKLDISNKFSVRYALNKNDMKSIIDKLWNDKLKDNDLFHNKEYEITDIELV